MKTLKILPKSSRKTARQSKIAAALHPDYHLFEVWRKRIVAGLCDGCMEDSCDRMQLMSEIQKDLAKRNPHGIAADLVWVLVLLNAQHMELSKTDVARNLGIATPETEKERTDHDTQAVEILRCLAEMEYESARINTR